MKLTKEQALYILNNPDSSPSPDIIKSLAELALKSFDESETVPSNEMIHAAANTYGDVTMYADGKVEIARVGFMHGASWMRSYAAKNSKENDPNDLNAIYSQGWRVKKDGDV